MLGHAGYPCSRVVRLIACSVLVRLDRAGRQGRIETDRTGASLAPDSLTIKQSRPRRHISA